MQRNLMHAVLGLALLAAPAGAGAEALNVSQLGAGVAIPFVTGIDLATKAVLTNAAGGDRRLHFDVINGDPGENWDVESFECTLTARETVEISFTSAEAEIVEMTTDGVAHAIGETSWIKFECDAVEGVKTQIGGDAGNDGRVSSNAARGVLWVTVQDADGNTVSDDALFADFTIFNYVTTSAASAPATAVQGGAFNDGDRKYTFDGFEYAKFPAANATNFHPPALLNDNFLLAFTLDGVTGAAPTVRVRVLWYDDDEHVEDDAFEFKCFDLVHYDEISPGLAALDTAGHMELIPVASALEPARPLVCYNHQDGKLKPCATSTSLFDRFPAPMLDTQL
jgi:hypothetical protein